MRNRVFVASCVMTLALVAGSSLPALAQQAPDQKPQGQEQKKQDPKKPQKPEPQKRKPQEPQRGQPPPQKPARQQPPPPQQTQPQRQPRQQQPPPPQQTQPQRQPRQQQPPPPQQTQPQRPQRQQATPPPPQQQAQQQRAQGQRQQAPPPATATRLPQPVEQQRIGQAQQRVAQYSTQLSQQQQLGEQRAAQLQQQNRTAQYRFQQQYIAGLNQQRSRISAYGSYNYGNDPYFYTPPIYRYRRAGRTYEINEYGANVLRQAVNQGYQEGFEAGLADREDHWAFSYRDSFAYQDADYGYDGLYVDRDDYVYYFREGFRRGYEDGYYGRHQYGVAVSGKYAVAAGILSVILGLQHIR